MGIRPELPTWPPGKCVVVNIAPFVASIFDILFLILIGTKLQFILRSMDNGKMRSDIIWTIVVMAEHTYLPKR